MTINYYLEEEKVVRLKKLHEIRETYEEKRFAADVEGDSINPSVFEKLLNMEYNMREEYCKKFNVPQLVLDYEYDLYNTWNGIQSLKN